jgi:radical SAM-linked protein
MARIWERCVRKLQLPIAYSEGFSPRAQLSFGLALPTVFESVCEYVDLTFNEPVGVDGLAERLTEVAPEGIIVTGIVALDGKVESLQECVESTSWALFVDGDPAALSQWCRGVLDASELLVTRERKGKTSTDDVRKAILALSVHPFAGPDAPAATAEIRAELAAKPRALRPLELLGINTPSCTLVLGRRVHQFIAPIGARRDPLAVGAAEAPHSLVCAS